MNEKETRQTQEVKADRLDGCIDREATSHPSQRVGLGVASSHGHSSQ
jgi:hypothetical protein